MGVAQYVFEIKVEARDILLKAINPLIQAINWSIFFHTACPYTQLFMPAVKIAVGMWLF
jgi:hypothetical protein